MLQGSLARQASGRKRGHGAYRHTDSAGAAVGHVPPCPGQSPREHLHVPNVRAACASKGGKVKVRDGEQREVTKVREQGRGLTDELDWSPALRG